MSSRRRTRFLAAMSLVFVFVALPGRLAVAATGPANGNGSSIGNGHGPGGPDDNGSGNDPAHPGNGSANGHGPGQDSPTDHDNGYGNDPPAETNPDPSAPVAGEGDQPPAEPENTDQTPPDDQVDPGHGPGQDSPTDHDNGYGNDPPAETNPDPSAPPAGEGDQPPVSETYSDSLPVLDPTGFPVEPVAEATTPDESTPEVAPLLPGPSPSATRTVLDLPAPQPLASVVSPALVAPGEPSGPPNQSPVANPGEMVALPGGTSAIQLNLFVTDLDGDSLIVTSHSLPENGTVQVQDGAVLFTPDPGFFGAETLTVTACDPSGACVDTRISVFVPPVNDILIATNGHATLARFFARSSAGVSPTALIGDLFNHSATRMAVPMAGAAGAMGASLLFGLHRVGTRLDWLRLFLKRG
jgi:hypothetical protein